MEGIFVRVPKAVPIYKRDSKDVMRPSGKMAKAGLVYEIDPQKRGFAKAVINGLYDDFEFMGYPSDNRDERVYVLYSDLQRAHHPSAAAHHGADGDYSNAAGKDAEAEPTWRHFLPVILGGVGLVLGYKYGKEHKHGLGFGALGLGIGLGISFAIKHHHDMAKGPLKMPSGAKGAAAGAITDPTVIVNEMAAIAKEFKGQDFTAIDKAKIKDTLSKLSPNDQNAAREFFKMTEAPMMAALNQDHSTFTQDDKAALEAAIRGNAKVVSDKYGSASFANLNQLMSLVF